MYQDIQFRLVALSEAGGGNVDDVLSCLRGLSEVLCLLTVDTIYLFLLLKK